MFSQKRSVIIIAGADVLVFPSFFEGFALVLLEAMACGLPAIASTATAGTDVLTEGSGRVLPAGDLDALVDSLRWFDQNRDRLPAMSARHGNRQSVHVATLPVRCHRGDFKVCVIQFVLKEFHFKEGVG